MKQKEQKDMKNLAYKTKKYTYEDLLALNDEKRYEINEKNIYTLPKTYDIKEDIKVGILKKCTISLKELMRKD